MKYIFLDLVAPGSVIFPLLISFAKFKTIGKAYKLLTYYLLITLFANVANQILSINHISNLLIFHAYTPIEALFLFQFFSFIFYGDKIVKAIQVLKFLFPAYCIVVFICFQNNTIFNSYTSSIEAILIIGLCMYYWWQSINHETDRNWTELPLNWIVSGILLYFSSALFYFIFSNVLRFNYSIAINYFIININAVMVMLMNFLFALGFYKCKK